MIPELCRIIAAYGHMLMYAIATHDEMAKCTSSSHSPAPRNRSFSICFFLAQKQQTTNSDQPELVERTSVKLWLAVGRSSENRIRFLKVRML